MNKLNKLIGSLLLSAFMLIGVGVNGNTKDVVRGDAASEQLIIDGSTLTSDATTDDTTVTYGDFSLVVSKGAKMQASTSSKAFSKDGAILIGKKGAYIYNTTPIGTKITKFEIYANTSASAKVTVGICFSNKQLSDYNSTGAYATKLSTLDSVYDASSALGSDSTYFYYKVTNANNSQVQFRITYESAAAVATKIASAALVDSSKVFYCGEEIKASDFIVKDDTGATITDFTIDKTIVPTDAGDFTLTFSKEGLTSFDLSLTAVAKVLDFKLSTTSISGMVGKKVNVKATANKFIENPNYTWEVSEGSDIVTLSATSGDNVDVTLANIGTAKIKVTETTSNVSKEISVTSEERVSTIKEPAEEATSTESTTIYEMVGKITGVFGNSYSFQDGEYGIYVYNDTKIKPSIGDIVYVKATTILFNGWFETKTVSEAKIDNSLDYIPFSSTELDDTSSLNDTQQNTIFDIKGLTYTSGTYSSSSNSTVTVTNSNNQKIRLYGDKFLDTTISTAVKEKIDTLIANKDTYTINVKNVILNKDKSGYLFRIPTADSIEIVENKPTSLKVELADSTKEYVAGSKLTASDLKVTKVFEDGSELTASTSDYTISPDISTYELIAGENVFTITSTKDETIKTTITINAIEDVLTELKVSGTARNQYVGEKLNTTDLVFTATYSKSGDKVISHSDITFSPDTMPAAAINNYTIKATYKDKEVSFNVNVIEREKGFYLSTNANELEAGDLLLIVNRSTSNVMSELSGTQFTTFKLNSLNKDTTFISWEDIYLTDAVYTVLSLGGSKDSWTLKDTIKDKDVATSSSGGFSYNTATTWKITYYGNNKTSIKSNVNGLAKPYIGYNSSTTKFSVYNPDGNITLYPELFVMKASVLEDTTVKTKLAALKWALSFNTNVIENCDPTGATIKIDYNQWYDPWETYDGLNDEIKAYLKDEVANENGNLIEKSLYYYDYILSKYPSSKDYVEYIEGRTISKSSTPLLTNSDNTETIALIAIISVVSLSAIGGYMFIRKRKEQ